MLPALLKSEDFELGFSVDFYLFMWLNGAPLDFRKFVSLIDITSDLRRLMLVLAVALLNISLLEPLRLPSFQILILSFSVSEISEILKGG